MSQHLVEVLEAALANLPRKEADLNVGDTASVVVQFGAGDWAAVRAALKRARSELDDVAKHNIADAAGVVSHTSGGQPLPVDTRLDMAEDTLPPVVAPVVEPAPEPVPAPVAAPGSPPAEPLPPA